MLMLICALRIATGSVLCIEGDAKILDYNKQECVVASRDPLTTCNIVVTKDKKKWFFIYGTL